jgi:hypothetical protein
MATIDKQAFSPPTLARLDLPTSQEKSRVWLSLLLLLIFSLNSSYHYLFFSPRSRSKSGRSASSITTITEGSKELSGRAFASIWQLLAATPSDAGAMAVAWMCLHAPIAPT